MAPLSTGSAGALRVGGQVCLGPRASRDRGPHLSRDCSTGLWLPPAPLGAPAGGVFHQNPEPVGI